MRTAILGEPTSPPRVAFAIARSVGDAPARNRVRRQLRAATREGRALLAPGRGYLFRAHAPAPYEYRELRCAVTDLLRRAGEAS